MFTSGESRSGRRTPKLKSELRESSAATLPPVETSASYCWREGLQISQHLIVRNLPTDGNLPGSVAVGASVSGVRGTSHAHHTTQHNTTQRRRRQHSLRQTPPRVAWKDKNTKRGDPLRNGAAQRETCTSCQPAAPHRSGGEEPEGKSGRRPGRSSLQQPHTSRMETTRAKYCCLSRAAE